MSAYDGLEIAIIGMSGQFPSSPDCNVYWQNLMAGKELITEYPDEALLKRGVRPEELADDRFVKSMAVLEGKEYFDHQFFDYRPEEAALMDPQTRIFHTHSWKALEDAGYASGRDSQKTGLFVTASDNDNWKIYSYIKAKECSVDPFFLQVISNEKFLGSLIAYKLDLRGPVVYLDSACSSSLVAIHLACRSLLTRECNLALSGGVKIGTSIRKGYHYQEGTIMSPDGRCRTFDIGAAGTIFGEGIGVVVLKRLSDAIKSKDNIYAVIRSSAINNDGHEKVGYTAPSVKGQSECIRMAHKLGGIDPHSIGYIEAHGTATKLGDPIEIAALNHAFQTESREKYCAIGSVKSNMGHLDTAAGVAGFIKTALSLKHRKIVPSLHFQQPNPKINFDGGPFYVNTELKDWLSNGDHPLRAGVSSFGIGGTNAHIVLEESPVKHHDPAEKSFPLLTLSGKNKASLLRHIEELKAFILNDPTIHADDIAFTLQVGRKHFNHRRAIAFLDREDLIFQLSKSGSGSREAPTAGVDVVFLFQGLGSQYVNMGRQLYQNELLFRQELDNGFRLLEALTGKNYKEIIYPAGTPTDEINITGYAQPIIFIFEYALAKLVMSWGIKAQCMIGQGPGEYVAACITGVSTFNDALRSVAGTKPLQQTVDFSTAIATLLSSGREVVFVEIGAGRHLFGFLEQRAAEKVRAASVHLIRGQTENFNDKVFLTEMIGQLWSFGVDIDWNGIYGNHFRTRISLPTYSFEPVQFPAEVDPFAGAQAVPVGLSGEVAKDRSDFHLSRQQAFSDGKGGGDSDLGKVKKRDRPDLGNVFTPPETSTERKVVELLENFLGMQGVGIDDNFFDLGGDSLQGMGFLMRIKNTFDIALPANTFFTDPTMKQVSLKIDESLLSGREEKNQTGWQTGTSGIESDHLVLLKPGRADRAIFVIPGAEGNALHFKEIAGSLENSSAIYGIQMMGLKEGEKPLTTIGEIARQNIEWIRQIQLSGPYKLIGFSFGGLVIYEMIRQMESAGDLVDYAAILDVSANATTPPDYGEVLLDVGCRLLEKLGIIMNPYPDWVLNLKEVLSVMKREEAIEYMICVLREKIDYRSEDVDFWIRVLEVTVINVLAIGPISGRINGALTIFRAAEVNWDEAGYDLGWSKYASHVEVLTVPGTHNQVFHHSLGQIFEHMDQKFHVL